VTTPDGLPEPTTKLPGRLDRLLKVPPDSRVSELERLRRGPVRVSGREMTGALDRASELAGVGAGAVDVSAVPANRIETLARDGLTAKPRCWPGAPPPAAPRPWWPRSAASPRPRSTTRWTCSGC